MYINVYIACLSVYCISSIPPTITVSDLPQAWLHKLKYVGG